MPTLKSSAKAQPPASTAQTSNLLVTYSSFHRHWEHGSRQSANSDRSKPGNLLDAGSRSVCDGRAPSGH